MTSNINVQVDFKDNQSLDKLINKTIKANKEITKMQQTASGEGTQYRQARGIAGVTGAGGRDFAKQAQGLGGLVHVYATFAANIFAVATAYEALNKVASITILEKTADIMSGRLGVSMKNLGKDIQQVTGYAVTMGEALQFGAMGTSAGLTGKQITNLVQIAKGAAAALGRDVGDATRRIIQGTAKQEQEILDELGIFVKAKRAYDEYAKARGMKAEDLSATQRVNAYAEAVAKAGEKWKEFANIEDPFARLTSTTKQAGTELLGIVNSIIMPIISFLSKSEGIVKTILLLITAKLGKMALPHLGEQLKSVFTTDPNVIRKFEEAKFKVTQEFNNKINTLEEQRAARRAALSTIMPIGIDKRTLNTTNLEKAREAVHAGIVSQIKTQNDLEAAKSAKLVTQKSTLSNINVMQAASLNIAKQIVAARTAELVILDKIKDLSAERVAKEEETHISQRPGMFSFNKAASSKNKALVASLHSEIIQDIGTTAIPASEKIVNTMGNLFKMVEGGTGVVGKLANTFRMLGVVGSLAIQGLMAAMPYLMAAFMAWELVISPLLYKIGFFSKESDKLAESTLRLNDQVKASTQGWKNANEGLSEYNMSVKALDSYYTQASNSASALLDTLSEQEASYKALVDLKGKSGTDEMGILSRIIFRTTDTEDAARTLQGTVRTLLDSGQIDKTSEKYAELSKSYEAMRIKLITHNVAYEDYIKLSKQAKDVSIDITTEQEKNRVALEKLINPINAVSTANDELNKRMREQLDPNLKQFRTAPGQAMYRGLTGGFLESIADPDTNRSILGLNATIEEFGKSTTGLPDATNRITRFAMAITLLKRAKLTGDEVGVKKLTTELSAMVARTVHEKEGMLKGAGGPSSRLDYSTEAARATESRVRAASRARPTRETIEAVATADIETARAAAQDRIRAINKEIALTGNLSREKELRDQSRIIQNEQERQANAEKQAAFDELALKNAQKQVSAAEATLSLSDKYTETKQAQVDLMNKELHLLDLKKDLTAEERRKEEKDIREKEAKTAREADLKRSVSTLLTEGGPSAAASFRSSLDAQTKADEEKARGPIEGTLNAFTSGVDSSMNTLFDAIQTGAETTSGAVETAFRNAASDIFKQLAIEQAKLAVQKTVSGVMGLFTGGATGGGLAGFNPAAAIMGSGYSAPALSANGNIMTSHGILPLNKYANGGIARSAQVSIFGEGRNPEAYVPLPDGRSIPVTMKNPSGGANIVNSGKTDINISIDQSGQTSSSASPGQGQANPAAFAQLISKIVQQEMTVQKAPGGLLYSGPR